LEQTLFFLILTYSQLEKNVAKSLFENMSTGQRLKFLRDCSESITKDNPMHEHLIHFIQCFDIVAENRNTLMHSVIRSTEDDGIMWFAKVSRRSPIVGRSLLLDIAVLRRTALDLQDVDVYGAYIFLNCHHLAPWSKNFQSRKKVSGLAPLVEKLALPSKLLIG
jgi:hypothetical protein